LEFSLKNISIAITIISALIGIVYKLIPRSSDRLKKDLELLKLAKETEVNHLPLERHINHRINEDYVRTNISIKQYLDIYFGKISLSIMLMVLVFLFLGLVVSYLLKVTTLVTPDTAENIIIGFLAFGVLGGVMEGQRQANETIKDIKKEMEARVSSIIEEDEKSLNTEPESVIVQP
jgi:hypothetical protein